MYRVDMHSRYVIAGNRRQYEYWRDRLGWNPMAYRYIFEEMDLQRLGAGDRLEYVGEFVKSKLFRLDLIEYLERRGIVVTIHWETA